MPRGKMLRTKIKEEVLASLPWAIAVEEAKRKIEQRKPLKQSVEEHIGKFIDRLDVDGVLKIAAVGSLALILKPIVQGSPEIAARFMELRIAVPVKSSFTGEVKGVFGYPNLFDLALGLGRIIAPELIGQYDEAKEKALQGVKYDEVTSWLMAVALAVLIVTFGPDLIKSFGSVGKLGLALLA